MNWKIFTRPVAVDHGIVIRWFWRKPVTQGRAESQRGFTTRAECEEDAMLNGYSKTEAVETGENPTPSE